jgi:hypothetical protein
MKKLIILPIALTIFLSTPFGKKAWVVAEDILRKDRLVAGTGDIMLSLDTMATDFDQLKVLFDQLYNQIIEEQEADKKKEGSNDKKSDIRD